MTETESWLYSDNGSDQDKSVYLDKLNKMKEYGEPIRRRVRENEAGVMGRFGKSVQQMGKGFLNYFK